MVVGDFRSNGVGVGGWREPGIRDVTFTLFGESSSHSRVPSPSEFPSQPKNFKVSGWERPCGHDGRDIDVLGGPWTVVNAATAHVWMILGQPLVVVVVVAFVAMR